MIAVKGLSCYQIMDAPRGAARQRPRHRVPRLSGPDSRIARFRLDALLGAGNMSAPAGYPPRPVGYGRRPPLADWPGRARVAVQFVLNYEEGGENCVLHGDAYSEQFLSEMFHPAELP